MKLVTVSVAPPGPPAVMVMTMSASLSLKMSRTTNAVSVTGSISGKMTFRKFCHAVAPSTRAASITSPGRAWSPASSMIIMNGMKIQASRTIIVSFAGISLAKNAGLLQPSARASCETGPKRNSSIDFPIIQDTATGDSIRGSRNATRKNRRARICACSSRARPKAMASSRMIARQYHTMLPRAFQ